MLNGKVLIGKMGKRVNKYGLFGRAVGESHVSLKRTWQVC